MIRVDKLKILYAGIRGLPPKYGGFERHVDQISRYLSSEMGQEVIVACEKPLGSKIETSQYHDVSLYYYPLIPGPRWLSETLFDATVFLSSFFIKKLDVVYYCGISAGFFAFIPRLLGRKVVANIGGYEWRNKKFHPILRSMLFINVILLILFSNKIVTDNASIRDYFKKSFLKDTALIPYSVDLPDDSCYCAEYCLEKYGLTYKKFFLTVTRIEMMNSIEYMILEFQKIYQHAGFSPLIIVGDTSTEYGRYIQNKYGELEYVHFIGFIHDIRELNLLRKSALVYIHGQVTGGTSPALLEALASGMIIASFDSSSNRSTLKNTNYYFSYDYDFYLKNDTYIDDESSGSSKSLSRVIVEILRNSEEVLSDVSTRNVQLARNEYGIGKIGPLHLELYKKLCGISTDV